MASDPQLDATKKALRKRMRDAASAPWTEHPGARPKADAAIAQHLTQSEAWATGTAVVAFADVRHEVRTAAVIQAARAANKAVYLPRIRGAVGEGQMTMHRVATDDELVPGPYDLLEPAADLPADLHTQVGTALILVPGLAFTRAGLRLGQGGGFYDRFLARLGEHAGPRPLIALAYDWQILEELPVDTHDQRVALIVSESGPHDCSSLG